MLGGDDRRLPGAHVRQWLGGAGIVLLAAACLLAGLNFGRTYRLAIGGGEDRYISGWRDDDEVVTENGQRRYFRWVKDEGRLRLPIVSRGANLLVRLHALRHQPGEVTIIANFATVFREDLITAPWRDYGFVVSGDVAGRGPLTLVFTGAPADDREGLVLAVDWLEVRSQGHGWILPSGGLAAACFLTLALLFLVSRRLAGRRAAIFIVPSASAAMLVGLLFWKIPAITIISRLWPYFLILWLLSFAHRALNGRPAGRVLLAGAALHAVIFFHPYLYPPDLHYHFRFAQKLVRMSLSEIYRVSVMYDIPGEFSLNYPYSPVFHLITGFLSPRDADLKYVEKLIVLVSFTGIAIALAYVSTRFGLGAFPLVLFFLDPTFLRHLYRCHMPGMFGISMTSVALLVLMLYPLPSLGRIRFALFTLFLSFAMCTYPASYIQLCLTLFFLTVLVVSRSDLRPELPRLLILGGAAWALALILFYGHYLQLILRFLVSSRQQVGAAGRTASLWGMMVIWAEMLNLEKAWPFYLPAIAGGVLLFRRIVDPRARAVQGAWGLAFVAQMILTSDFFLPSVRVHIKEMAFLTPVLLLWQAEAFERAWERGRLARIAAAGFFALLLVLSVAKMSELIRLGFTLP